MKDIIRCDNCRVVVKEEQAKGWWTVSRLYPIPAYGAEPETVDFCTEKCFNEWIDKQRARRSQ